MMDCFLDFTKSSPAIKGESQDDMFKDTMHITSYTFGVAQKGTSSTGSGLGAGKAEFNDFEFKKSTDMSSPPLMKHCAGGTHFDKVLLHLRKAGGKQLEFQTVTFKSVLISSFEQSGSEESEESIKFNYQSLFFEYKPQLEDGTLGSPTSGGWDLKKNVEVDAA